MLKVYDLIQELSKCDADAEVVFKVDMQLSIESKSGIDIESDIKGTMVVENIRFNPHALEIGLKF